MGIHNREYLRDDLPPHGSFAPPGTRGPRSAVTILIIFNVAVFLLTWMEPRLGELLELPATFYVAGQDGAQLHRTAPLKGVPPRGILPAGRYVLPLRGGRVEFLRLRRIPEIDDKLTDEFRANPAGYTTVQFRRKEAGESIEEVSGVVRSAEIQSIAWQFPWRVITYGFCHDHSSLWHLAFNMMCLWVFGRMIESILGRREFFCVYLLGVLLSGLCHLGLQLGLGDVVPMVGASGGVMTLMVVAAMHFPRQKVLLMMIFPIELGVLVIGLVLLDVLGLFDSGSHVARAAHLGGAAFGFVYQRSGLRISDVWGRFSARVRFWKQRAARPKIRVHRPSVDGLDDQVDAILAKIVREGEASLSESERGVLMEASRRKRKQR
ncbi:MAG: rhomboid family intramembrane serine protease [Planctomycetaceae bacterium]